MAGLTAMEGGPQRDLPGAVLFACTMNTVRSPMAAAMMQYLTGPGVYVVSAGVRPGEQDPFACAVMDEIGLDISGHEPIEIGELSDTTFDLVVTLSPEAHHQALELTRTMAVDVEYWPTLDATAAAGNREQILDAYRKVRDSMMERIKQRFDIGAPAGM